MCFVSYKIVQHRERYTCPECGTKRIHHRRYLNTTSVTKTYSSNQSGLDTTTYTHHYHDTYVCPHCGETKHENVSKHGGTLRVHDTGYVDDSRIAPREF